MLRDWIRSKRFWPTMWAAMVTVSVAGCSGGIAGSRRTTTRCYVAQPGYCETSWSSLESICGQTLPIHCVQSSTIATLDEQPEVLSLPVLNSASANRRATAHVSDRSFIQSASFQERVENDSTPPQKTKFIEPNTQQLPQPESFDYFRP